MFCALKTLARRPDATYMLTNKKQLVRFYRGGVPGCNLPWRVESPTRFTVFFFLAGLIGFGAPWLVIMHQMLRPYDYVVD